MPLNMMSNELLSLVLFTQTPRWLLFARLLAEFSAHFICLTLFSRWGPLKSPSPQRIVHICCSRHHVGMYVHSIPWRIPGGKDTSSINNLLLLCIMSGHACEWGEKTERQRETRYQGKERRAKDSHSCYVTLSLSHTYLMSVFAEEKWFVPNWITSYSWKRDKVMNPHRSIPRPECKGRIIMIYYMQTESEVLASMNVKYKNRGKMDSISGHSPFLCIEAL